MPSTYILSLFLSALYNEDEVETLPAQLTHLQQEETEDVTSGESSVLKSSPCPKSHTIIAQEAEVSPQSRALYDNTHDPGPSPSTQ